MHTNNTNCDTNILMHTNYTNKKRDTKILMNTNNTNRDANILMHTNYTNNY